MKRIRLIAAAALCFSSAAWAGDISTQPWQQIGPGGGGRLMYPAVDSSNPNRLLCGSDMGTAYQSDDNGATWSVYPWPVLNAVNGSGLNGRGSWAFDPHRPGSVWVGTSEGFFHSTDDGKSWSRLSGAWETVESPQPGPSSVAVSPSDPNHIAAAFSVAWFVSRKNPVSKVFLSADGGQSWNASADLNLEAKESIRNIFFDPTDQAVVVIAQRHILRSDDAGKTWLSIAVDQFPKDESGQLDIADAAAAYDGKRLVAYLTTSPTPADAEHIKPGIYRSEDAGRTWQQVAGRGLDDTIAKGKPAEYNLVQPCPTQPDRVYATLVGYRAVGDIDAPNHATVYRSDDGGATWTPTLFQHPKMSRFNVTGTSWTIGQWGWASTLSGMAVDAQNADRVLVTTINGSLLTIDGGKTWKVVHSAPMQDTRNEAGGMAIMSAWHYAFDPHQPERQYISMTDFGGWMTDDNARTWTRCTDGNPWAQNTYGVAFDPKTPGRMWAACSPMHDIPFYANLTPMLTSTGGVVRSDDGGKTWQKACVDKSLPPAAMTDITLLPGSGGEPDTLFVAAMGRGIYSSTDGGTTWKPSKNGFDAHNKAFLRIMTGPANTLYALTTYYRKSDADIAAGALYVSTDRGQSWREIFERGSTPFPVTAAVDPHDPKRLLVATMPTTPTGDDGGVWTSADGGETWTQTLRGAFWGGSFSPNQTGRVYAASFRTGLKVSDDGGRTWWTDKTFPVWRPTGVFFNPAQPSDLYVTAFGAGVWKIDEHAITRARAMEPTARDLAEAAAK